MTITYTYGKKLYVNLTNQCPNACDFCLRTQCDGVGDADSLWMDREPTKEEMWEDIRKHDLDRYPELVFCGYGEPTCRLDDMLWLCKKIRETSSVTIRVNTNGLSDLINQRPTAKEFSGLVDIVSVSLNAPTPEKYDSICHSKYGLDALPAILQFTKSVGIYVPKVYMTVVDTLSYEDITACSKLCESTGARFRVRVYSDNWKEPSKP